MSRILKNQVKTIVLLGVLSAAVVGLGGLLAPGYLTLFIVLALAFNLGAYFYSDRLVLRMHRAEEITPRDAPWLHRTVADLAERAGVPMPRLYLIPEDHPNAFATGRNPAHGVVAVTRGILDVLDRRELRGVLAHEIAHIKNRDVLISSIAAAMSSVITYGAHALSLTSLFGSGDGDEDGSQGSGLLVALVAPIGAALVQMAISRSREYVADDAGARLSDDPEGLASALLRLERSVARTGHQGAAPATASLFIVNPLLGRMSRLFSTHPPTEERVRRLTAMGRRFQRSRRRRSVFLEAA